MDGQKAEPPADVVCQRRSPIQRPPGFCATVKPAPIHGRVVELRSDGVGDQVARAPLAGLASQASRTSAASGCSHDA